MTTVKMIIQQKQQKKQQQQQEKTIISIVQFHTTTAPNVISKFHTNEPFCSFETLLARQLANESICWVLNVLVFFRIQILSY